MTINGFNIRVYALIINDKQEVLVSDEIFMKERLTKFPGGGLHFGEGAIDCVKREAIEELGQEIEVIGHFYTLDKFIPTRFYKDKQLLAIYYLAKLKVEAKFKISEKPFDFTGDKDGTLSIRRIPIRQLNTDEFTFETDRFVGKELKKRFSAE